MQGVFYITHYTIMKIMKNKEIMKKKYENKLNVFHAMKVKYDKAI